MVCISPHACIYYIDFVYRAYFGLGEKGRESELWQDESWEAEQWGPDQVRGFVQLLQTEGAGATEVRRGDISKVFICHIWDLNFEILRQSSLAINNLIAADTESCYFEYERIFSREMDDFQVFKVMLHEPFSESWENRRH